MASGAFGFTEEEWYQALRLVRPEDEARQGAADLAEPTADEMDWAMSAETLALLSVSTESARSKADRLRKEEQMSRYRTWVLDETQAGPVPADKLSRRWAALLRDEDAAWEILLRDVRRSLQEQSPG